MRVDSYTREFSKQIETFFPYEHEYEKINNKYEKPLILDCTLQLTSDCCCRCTYCYQPNKKQEYMSTETVKDCIDFLLRESDNMFKNSKGLAIHLIGGEPLLNLDAIEFCVNYFYSECIRKHHRWLLYTRFCIDTNGAKYFEPKFQDFLKKFNKILSLNVTVDGPEDVHDACRVYEDGSGNFKDAWKAFQHYRKNYYPDATTKITISPDNMPKLYDIVKFFIDNGMYSIYSNVIFEHEWTIEESRELYFQLKKVGNFILNLPDDVQKQVYFKMLNYTYFNKLPDTSTSNWCGGDGSMICFSSSGNIYPCLRYTETSLGERSKKFIIGTPSSGIYTSKESKKLLEEFNSITRQSQSPQECLDCSINSGCSWCTANNYEQFGTINKKSTSICWTHRACSLAAVYYWNNYCLLKNLPNYLPNNLPDDISLRLVGEEELQMLLDLEKKTKSRKVEFNG